MLELHDYIDNLGDFQKLCVEKGVWIRPFGHNAYIMPPYMAVTDAQLEKLAHALIDIVTELYER